jgi:hypothetical protein
MRARIAWILTCVLFASGAAVAAGKLAPADIQSTFFTGEAFTSASPSGVKFKMIFTADGKAKRTPVAKAGARGEGDWSLDAEGYCTTWKGSKANCFTVVPNGQNKWNVMKGSTVMATWSK